MVESTLAPRVNYDHRDHRPSTRAIHSMEIAILFTLIVFNRLLAMSEMALVTVRKARLQKLVDG